MKFDFTTLFKEEKLQEEYEDYVLEEILRFAVSG